MLEKNRYAMHSAEDNESTADKMSWLCFRGECPIAIDAYSGCPVMELCRKSCCEIGRKDWVKWLESEGIWQ